MPLNESISKVINFEKIPLRITFFCSMIILTFNITVCDDT